MARQTSRHSLSLYEDHLAVISQAITLRGLRGNSFSPAVQYIIEDWAKQRGLAPSPPPSPPSPPPDPTWVQPTQAALAEGNEVPQGESEDEATPNP